MNARWRLGVLTAGLAILVTGTYLATGNLVTSDVWFLSGLLAVVINPVLLEPFYPRPYDIVANSIFGLLLYLLAERRVAATGWTFLLVFLLASLTLAAAALVLGAGRGSRFSRQARAARLLSSVASAKAIYSALFWLSLTEQTPPGTEAFGVLGVTWALILLVGSINWQGVWSTLASAPEPAHVHGLVGPARLLVSAPDLPDPGTSIALRSGRLEVAGVMLTRIPRLQDTWGEVHIQVQPEAEALLRAGSIAIATAESGAGIVGAVGAGSTDRQLVFTATRALEIGDVVAVPQQERHVLYQLASADIQELKVKGGSHLVVSAHANQIGVWNREEFRLTEHRWTPPAGAPVLAEVPTENPAALQPPDHYFLVGSVIGTTIPVYLDLEVACEGHIAILGMTKMGKTTFALRLARALARGRRVVVLDGTGEYVAKRGLPAHDGRWTPGVFVHEPPPGSVEPDFALSFVEATARTAAAEYQAGPPIARSIMFEEAQQFIPEPAGLGFGAPGRDSAYRLGVEIMQLRKYGLSMILISQRTAVVAKSALSQCETVIAFRSVDQTGLDYLDQIAGGGVRMLLPSLRQGEALILGPAVSADRPVAVTCEP